MSRRPPLPRLLHDDLPDSQRLAIFAECRADGIPPDPARAVVARRFDITRTFVRRVETEGEEKKWSPLE
jgi:hypothetical protein